MTKEEKLKQLSSGAIKNIKKNYGDEDLFFGEKEIPKVPVMCSSGSLALDEALVIGGFPEGRVIEIAGNESCGKCLTSDTYIATEGGYKTIEEIFNENDLETFCVNKTTEKSYSLYNRYLDKENTTHFTHNGRHNVFELKTRTGNIIKGTANHPLLVMSENGNPIWKKVQDIKDGDYVVCQRNEFFGGKQFDSDFMYGIGILLADGSFQEDRIQVTNDDKDIKNFIEFRISSILEIDNMRSYDNNNKGSKDYHFSNKKKVQEFYEKYSIKEGVAKHKNIPKIFREGDYNSLKNLIQGYMDCESYCSSDRGIEVTSASYDLLFQLKLILSQFGIISFLSEKNVKGYEHNDYWRLCVAGKDCITFIKKIGTRSEKVKKRYDDFISLKENQQSQTNHDTVPNIKHYINDLYSILEDKSKETCKMFGDYKGNNSKANITLERLNNLVSKVNEESFIKDYFKYLIENNFYFDKVDSVEKKEGVPTFDFAMEKSHSFIANSIISHNTTVTLLNIAEIQNDDKLCAYIDGEQTFDPSYASKLGVNPKELTLYQTNVIEDALEVTLELINSSVISYVVMDSMNAFISRKEIEGEVGDAEMGRRAKLWSQTLPKLVKACKDNKCTLVIISQLREKIGISYGDNSKIGIGNSLKFNASVRIKVYKKDVSKDDKGIIGQDAVTIKANIFKNKVGVPYRIGEFRLLTGQLDKDGNPQYGVDKKQEVIDYAVKYNLIDKAGSWYSYKGEKIGQGSSKVKIWFDDNPDIFKDIESQIRTKLEEKLNAERKNIKVEDNSSFNSTMEKFAEESEPKKRIRKKLEEAEQVTDKDTEKAE